MNEYTFQIWGKLFSLDMELMSTEVIIANDGVEAIKQAKKLADKYYIYCV